MEIFSKIVSFLCWKLIRRTNTGELRRKERWWGEITGEKTWHTFINIAVHSQQLVGNISNNTFYIQQCFNKQISAH